MLRSNVSDYGILSIATQRDQAASALPCGVLEYTRKSYLRAQGSSLFILVGVKPISLVTERYRVMTDRGSDMHG